MSKRPARRCGETGGGSRTALVIMSVVLAVALLAHVSLVAAVRQSGPELVTIIRRTWLPIFLLTFPYLGARYVVWHELLAELRVSVR